MGAKTLSSELSPSISQRYGSGGGEHWSILQTNLMTKIRRFGTIYA